MSNARAQAFGVVVRGDCGALLHGGADDHHVADHRRRGVDADLAGLEIDRLLGAAHGTTPTLRSTMAVGVPNPFTSGAGLGVELDQPDSPVVT